MKSVLLALKGPRVIKVTLVLPDCYRQSGMEGDAGSMGPQGPKGDTGLQGLQGPPGPASSLQLRRYVATSEFDAFNIRSVIAYCGPGEEVLSGGFQTSHEGEWKIEISQPTEEGGVWGWRVLAFNSHLIESGTLKVFAICTPN